MPAVLTHFTFAQNVMREPGGAFREALLLGAQGPDPFFFFGQKPWAKRAYRDEVVAFGHELHEIDVAPIYYTLLEYANKSPAKELLYRYIEGLFLHFVLDRACHPFVFSRAGFSAEKGKDKYYSACHTKLESYIDILLGKENGTFSYHPENCLKLPLEQLKAISAMWAYANGFFLKKEHFDERSFFLSVRDYQSVLHFVNTPHKMKRWLLEKLLGVNSVPYNLNYPEHFPQAYAQLDFLNENHASWPNPGNGVLSQHSFREEMDQAQDDYDIVVGLLDEAKAGRNVLAELTHFVNNRSHNGIPIGTRLTYCQPIWPDIPKEMK